MIRRDLHERNRAAWNEATKAHNSHKGDQAAFLRGGGSTLFPEEVGLLGDVRGRSLLHLQCNAGQDTLSIASRLGAKVTGVDISDEAIGFARMLSGESGVPGDFVRSDVYDYLERSDDRFDVVFSSYGAINWLSNLDAWARGIARVLRPGGRFVLVEFHPVAIMFEVDGARKYPYSTHGAPLAAAGVGDYVALSGEGLTPGGFHEGVRDFVNPHHGADFPWGLGEVVSAVIGAGLRLETLREWPYANGCRLYDEMTMGEGRRWVPPGPEMPLMFGLAASAT